MISRFLFSAAVAALALGAHPMGNFSVNHYARLAISARGVEVRYVLDLAEIPTFELLREWKLQRGSPRAELDRKAAGQAREWARHLVLTVNGKRVEASLESTHLTIADGAGNLPIVRIASLFHLNAAPGRLAYEDLNFPGRAGWKEIVILDERGARIQAASQGSVDRSKALIEYPQDPTVAPPQDLRASVEWTSTAPLPITRKLEAPVIRPIPQPAAPTAAAPATMTPQAAPPGAVVRGDFLSRLLHKQDLSWGMILLALAVAFGLGAAHALTPGHGKTIVAAYLVGSRGTLKHAALLGAMVTFTHTASVFLLGLATLFLFRFIMPEKITEYLGAVSGLSIVAIGGWMIRRRLHGLPGHSHPHHHHHHDHHHHDHDHHDHDDHDHDHHHHAHDHDHHHHVHDHRHDEDQHHDHDHDHDHGHDHHHHYPEELSWGALAALGASGGLVPCESALVLLLSAIALNRAGLGLLLLVSFSLGLAVVLMGIGVLVLFARHLVPEKRMRKLPAFRWIPVFSGAVVVCAGAAITAVSLGWLAPKWLLG